MTVHIFSHQDNKNARKQGMKHWQLLAKVVFLFFSYFVNLFQPALLSQVLYV